MVAPSPELDQKRALRRELLARRLAMPVETRRANDAAMVRSMVTWLRGANATFVFLYLAHRGEPDLKDLAVALPTLAYALPVIAADKDASPTMEFRTWVPGDQLAPNRFGILEPTGGRVVTPDRNTVVLVPALAVDRRGYRLGYGAGYYDRYLDNFADATTVGIVDQEFVVESLPRETHDRPMKLVVTETGIESLPRLPGSPPPR